MKHFGDYNSFVIHGWMSNKLGLKGTDRIVYAIVYSFTQGGNGEFFGGHKYMAEAASKSVDTIRRSLQHLEDLGLIEKKERENDGVSRCRYSAFVNDDGEGIFKEGAKSVEGSMQNADRGSMQNAPSYNNKENIYNNKENNKEKNNNVREGFVFPDDKEANFLEWCNTNIPNLMRNTKPLKYSQYIQLQCDGFAPQKILDKLLYMNALAGFNRKYHDVYGVLKNWLNGDDDPNYYQKFRNKKNTDKAA